MGGQWGGGCVIPPCDECCWAVEDNEYVRHETCYEQLYPREDDA